MISAEVLRAIRNDLPMSAPDPGRVSVKPASGPVAIRYLARDGPYAKVSEGFFRFVCPRCRQIRATVNPKSNLAHFSFADPAAPSPGQVCVKPLRREEVGWPTCSGAIAVTGTSTTLICFCRWDTISRRRLHCSENG